MPVYPVGLLAGEQVKIKLCNLHTMGKREKIITVNFGKLYKEKVVDTIQARCEPGTYKGEER